MRSGASPRSPTGLAYWRRARSAPEDGKANAAPRALIAAHLGMPSLAPRLSAGAKSRVEQVTVAGDSVELIAHLAGMFTAF